MLKLIKITIFLILCGIGGTGHAHIQLTVGAASSLTSLVEDVSAEFVKINGSVKINTSAQASSYLFHQIKAGAPIDIFLSASKKYIDSARNAKLISSSLFLFSNELVIVSNKKLDIEIKKLSDLKNSRILKIALAPRGVPLGDYTFYSLDKASLTSSLYDKFVFAEHAKATFHLMKSSVIDVGIVYKSDVLTEKSPLKVLYTFPKESGALIQYEGAVVASTKHKEIAETFLKFFAQQKELIMKHHFKID